MIKIFKSKTKKKNLITKIKKPYKKSKKKKF